MSWLSRTGPHPIARPAPPVAEHQGLAGKKVLVVDDDIRNVYAITSSLEEHGVTVLRASDGREGIAVLAAEPDVDLILMDVMMPEMDGYATMAAIRRMPAFAALPIIAVTARAMPGDREKSLGAGASDYVTKPVDTEELLSRMERWLTGRPDRLPAQPARRQPPSLARHTAPQPPAVTGTSPGVRLTVWPRLPGRGREPHRVVDRRPAGVVVEVHVHIGPIRASTV